MEDVILRIILGLICVGGFVYIGVCCFFFPDKTLQTYLSYYKLDEGLKLENPRTWLIFRPNRLAVRIAGVVSLLVGLFVLYALILLLLSPN